MSEPGGVGKFKGNSNKGLTLEEELAEAKRREEQSERDREACRLSKARKGIR